MKESLISIIKQIYPDFIIKDCYINDIGQNNDVLIINKKYVFRFPKYNQGIIQLKKEIAILEYINSKVTIPVPRPIYQSFEQEKLGEVFAGYCLIAGEPLWKNSFEHIKDTTVIKGLASQLVNFLIELHSIPKEKITGVVTLNDTHPRDDMAELFDKTRNKLFPFLGNRARDEITKSFENFLLKKDNIKIHTTLIHGDFGASNILWDPELSELTGVIDFGGVGLGDPAYDLAGILSSYGEEFFDMCIELYPHGKEISERAMFYKNAFALQEAIHGIEHHDHQAFENGLNVYKSFERE